MKNELKHGITKASIEALFHNRPFVGPDLKHSNLEDRFLALGHDSNRRHMIVAFTFRIDAKGKKLIRPISARYMHKKEVLKYEEAFAKNDK